MTYLLDTHYLLWSLFETKKINKKVKKILEDSDSKKVISGVSLWEISIKYSLGKLRLGPLNPDQVFEVIPEAGFDLIEIENQLLASYYQLPKIDNHKDPFDRLLIWQAISNGYTLLTQDKLIEQYQSNGLDLIVA